jgi:hypothetical protein
LAPPKKNPTFFADYNIFVANPGYIMVNVWHRAGRRGDNFRYSFLCNYLSQPLDIWYTAWALIWLDSISGLSLIHFPFYRLSSILVNGKKFNFHNSFFSNYLSQPLDIRYTALSHGPILWDWISGLSFIHFLFTDFDKFPTLMVSGKKFFLSNFLSHPLDIWNTLLICSPILWDPI